MDIVLQIVGDLGPWAAWGGTVFPRAESVLPDFWVLRTSVLWLIMSSGASSLVLIWTGCDW